MKRAFLFFCGILVIVSCEKLDSYIIDSIEYKWMSELTSSKYKGRKTGTEECMKAADYISNELKQMGYMPVEQHFMCDDSLVMRNIYVRVLGKTDSLIIVGAHYDGAKFSSKYQAADDNASGVVALLSICNKISRLSVIPKKTFLFCFWDGEETVGNSCFNGSRYFVKSFPELHMVNMYCNLDCVGRKNKDIYFYYSDGKEIYSEKMKSLLKDYRNSNYSISYKKNENSGSDYVSFRKVGIPFCGWNDYDVFDYIHSTNDNIKNISFEKIYNISDLTIKMIMQL